MKELTPTADVLRRVEKIEIDLAVLDSKSNRLHQDMKETRQCIELMREDFLEKNEEVQRIARKTQTLVIAVPAVLALLYQIIQLVNIAK